MSSWNRPTLNWSLDCEIVKDGQTTTTRKEAIEIVSGSLLKDSYSIGKIRSWSIWFTFIFIGALLIPFIGAKENAEPDVFIPIFFFLLRFVYIIYAPPVGVYIYAALGVNDESQEKVKDLERVAACMDDYTTLNTDQVTG